MSSYGHGWGVCVVAATRHNFHGSFDPGPIPLISVLAPQQYPGRLKFLHLRLSGGTPNPTTSYISCPLVRSP